MLIVKSLSYDEYDIQWIPYERLNIHDMEGVVCSTAYMCQVSYSLSD